MAAPDVYTHETCFLIELRSEPYRGVRQESWGPESGARDTSEQEVTVRKAVRSAVVAVLAFVVVAMPSVTRADGRVALVVGNSTYAHIGRLPNPDSDARDMAAALRRLGFEVTTEFDADRMELTEALRAFTRQSAGADVSLVFYAGHGIEMDGVNYLVPVDARLERDVDVGFETVTVDDLLVSTTGASLRLVILDACRNNPLARSMQRTAAFRSVSGGSFADLAELGDETLVAHAASAGTTVDDGRARNSPFTAAVLSHLETPLEIGLLFRRVRAAVLAATNGAQRAHEYHSLVGDHYLTRPLAAGTSVTASAAPANPAPADPPRADPPEPDITELHIVTLRERAEAGDAAAQHEMRSCMRTAGASAGTSASRCRGMCGRPSTDMCPRNWRPAGGKPPGNAFSARRRLPCRGSKEPPSRGSGATRPPSVNPDVAGRNGCDAGQSLAAAGARRHSPAERRVESIPDGTVPIRDRLLDPWNSYSTANSHSGSLGDPTSLTALTPQARLQRTQ